MAQVLHFPQRVEAQGESAIEINGPYISLTEHLKQIEQVLSGLDLFLKSLNDEYLVCEPWFVFRAWLDSEYKPDHIVSSIFRAWQMFHWRPDPETSGLITFNNTVQTIAGAYIQSRAGQLTLMQKEILVEAQAQSLDLYSVIGLSGDHLILRGLIKQNRIMVYEPELSKTARIGEFVLALAIPIADSRYAFVGVSQFFSRKNKLAIDQFCQFLDIRARNFPRQFQSFESDLFNLFYDLTEGLS